MLKFVVALFVMFATAISPSFAALIYPPFSSSNPLAATYGGLGPYALPTPASGSTDFFDGDSITAGVGAGSCTSSTTPGTLVTTPSGSCYADVVATNDGAKAINTAVTSTCLEYTTTASSLCNKTGTTVGSSGSLINRYAADAALMSAGMRVYLMIGTNDITAFQSNDPAVNITTFRANLVTVASAYAAAVGPTGRVILSETPYSPTLDQSFAALINATIADVATQYGYSLAPTGSALQGCANANPSDTGRCLISDRLHPDSTGHASLAAAIATANYENAVVGRNANLRLSQVWESLVPSPAQTQSNTILGFQALLLNTTSAVNNVALGQWAGYTTSSGSNNVAAGYSALYFNTTGGHNVALGTSALQNNTTASNNVAIGDTAGRYITSFGANQTSNNSIYIGATTLAKANADTNEIVIGANATGIGSNTVAVQSGTAPGFYSGTGAPTFSAPNASIYLRYDGGTGARWYANTSGASTSGTTWTAQSAP